MSEAAQEVFTEKNDYFRDGLKDSLSLAAVKLFAVAVKADAVIAREELDYVHAYLDSFSAGHVSEYLFARFEEFLHGRLTLAAIGSEIGADLSHADKIFLLMKIYELLGADKVEKVELETAKSIADALQIESSDVKFIESIYGLADPAATRNPEFTLVPLLISDDALQADVYLPYDGLKLEVYRINETYCAIKKDAQSRVVIDNLPLMANFAMKISHNHSLQVNNSVIAFEDLKLYFRNKVRPPAGKTLYLSKENHHFALKSGQMPESLLKIELAKSLIALTPLTEGVDLLVNGSASQGKIYVNLNDRILVHNSLINLREIVLDQILAKEKIAIYAGKSVYTISNYLHGDLVVTDGEARLWQSEISKIGDKYYLNPGNCPYDIYRNQKKVAGSCELLQNDILYLFGITIRCDFAHAAFEKTTFSFRNYIVSQLHYMFGDESVGIDDVSFEIEHGDFAAIMGPSGCGKSTLLSIMNGYYRPKIGEILVNFLNLEQNFNIIKDYFGYVPQDDLLFENLTVYENLYYNARLRYPRKKKEDLEALIYKVLADIGMTDKKSVKVGSPLDKRLSGGERKRLNIGLELLGDAEIFFLDEPTSGLSSKDSEKVMDLLKKFSLRGKIVFVVIHQPSSKLYKMFDKLILLDKGGKLAFFGPTYAALKYFKNHSVLDASAAIECPACMRVEPSLILDILEEPLRDIDGLPLPQRKYSPLYWKQSYLNYKSKRRGITVEKEKLDFLPPPKSMTWREEWLQFVTLLSRNFTNKIRNRSNLLITFLEAPLLGGVVGFILKYARSGDYNLYDNDLLRVFIFLCVIVSIFLAMTNSVDEIIKDGAILLREKMLNLKNRGYLASKFLALLAFAFVQNALFLLVGFWILEIKSLYFHYLWFLTLVSMSGLALGLLISSLPKLSEKAALNIVPLILIPQIIFGGALIRYEQMNKQLRFYEKNPIPEICQLMTSRWAFEGLMVMQDTFVDAPARFDSLQAALKQFGDAQQEFIKQNREAEFRQRKATMKQEADSLRQKILPRYGNYEVHLAIQEADARYVTSRRNRGAAGQATSAFWRSYPMFVSQKTLPLLNVTCSTVYYNALVILVIISILSFGALGTLRYREKLLYWGAKAGRLLQTKSS